MIVRKQFPLLLSDEERELFETYGKLKGWNVSKTIRITCRALILADINKTTLDISLAKATLLDGEGKGK